MWLTIEINSVVNPDANCRYLLDFSGEVDLSLEDIASFFEVLPDEIKFLRVFNHTSSGEESFNFPVVYVTPDEMFFA